MTGETCLLIFHSLVLRKENLSTRRSTDLRNSVDPDLWCFKTQKKNFNLDRPLALIFSLSWPYVLSGIIVSLDWFCKQDFYVYFLFWQPLVTLEEICLFCFSCFPSIAFPFPLPSSFKHPNKLLFSVNFCQL